MEFSARAIAWCLSCSPSKWLLHRVEQALQPRPQPLSFQTSISAGGRAKPNNLEAPTSAGWGGEPLSSYRREEQEMGMQLTVVL